MKAREQNPERRTHRRWLMPLLMITMAGSALLIAVGSNFSVLDRLADNALDDVIVDRWGIPIGTVVWMALGLLLLVVGTVVACRSPRQGVQPLRDGLAGLNPELTAVERATTSAGVRAMELRATA